MKELTPPAAFIVALGRLLEAVADPDPKPGSREAALEAVHLGLRTLLRQNAFPSFSFRYGEVEYEGELLDELRNWTWGGRLPEAGVERLDITPGTTREDLEGFVEEVASRLFLKPSGASLREVAGQSGIQFGELDPGGPETDPGAALPPLRFDLDAEAEAMAWLNDAVAERGIVPVAEATAVVQLLSIAMHSERDVVLPLVQLKSVDQYTTTHSMNVACLSMALAEHLRYSSVDVRAIGEAALLHDVGKTRIPLEILNKQGKLTDEEWKRIQAHTVEGARILLASGRMELAATVAYEHHLSWRGEGYPELSWKRQPHPVSRLIQVCDIYDALRTRRPFRPPWPHERAVEFLRERAGEYLDPEYAEAFLAMIRQWEPRQVVLETQTEKEGAAA
ncbi:MAG: HD domain-containing protein [Gemmatimonadota bacterium]